MATTTNYGWTTPDDTALVKDGAAAIRTLGSSVDTTTKNLNPSTTLGDIEYRSSTANTNTRLGIGSTSQVLTVTGGVPVWATPSSGGMTLISTTTLTGASISLSSIPATYNDLRLVIRNFIPATDGSKLSIRVNGDSGANRHISGDWASLGNSSFDRTNWDALPATDNATNSGNIIVDLYDYTNATTWKSGNMLAAQSNSTTPANIAFTRMAAFYNQTGAITSLDLFSSSGNMTSGTCLLYGVK